MKHSAANHLKKVKPDLSLSFPFFLQQGRSLAGTTTSFFYFRSPSRYRLPIETCGLRIDKVFVFTFTHTFPQVVALLAF